MPWWIWLILALFMLAMIVAGLIYAALHGIRALKTCPTSAASSVNAWPRWSLYSADTSEPPLFTQPLSVTRIDAEAHADVIRSKAAKRERHTQLMGPLEAIQQLTESSNGTSPTP